MDKLLIDSHLLKFIETFKLQQGKKNSHSFEAVAINPYS